MHNIIFLRDGLSDIPKNWEVAYNESHLEVKLGADPATVIRPKKKGLFSRLFQKIHFWVRY